METRDILSAISTASEGRIVTLVGIDGPGGSGKSTLARHLRDGADGIKIVEGDDFYRPMPEADRVALSAREGYERNFDWERLREQVLAPLRSHNSARFQRYDWPSASLAEWHDVAAEGIVIVEGVYALRPQLRDFYDLTLFVDTPREERVRRMLDRNADDSERITRWMAAEDWYLDNIDPRSYASVAVRGQSL